MIAVQPFDRSQSSTLIDLKGKVTWVQVGNLNRFGKWSLNFYPDETSLNRFRELQLDGLRNQLKKDDTGLFFQISRPPEIEFSKGVKTPVSPVKVRDKDKQPLEEAIGDGSDVVVTCELYSFRVPNTEKRAVALRLYGITVETLVPKTNVVTQTEQPESVW
jgi:hypothetical protein